MLYISNLHRRSVIVGLSTAAMLVANPVLARARKPTILFVCQFGSVKSAIAREHFRKRAKDRGIQVSVSSRGITPEAHLSEQTKAALTAEGINSDRQPLRQLKKVDVAGADITVYFDSLPAGFQPKQALDWTDTGSLNQSYAAERPRLIARIDALLDDIAAKRVP